jgi:hypothetical protein
MSLWDNSIFTILKIPQKKRRKITEKITEIIIGCFHYFYRMKTKN